MYGHTYRQKEERKLAKKEKKNEKHEAYKLNKFVKKDVAQRRGEREQSYARGRARGEEFINRNIQGLTPDQKSAMQYEASRNVRRGLEGAHRRLGGELGQRGVRGGVAYAQRRDLERAGMEARGQSERDINQLDANQRLKNLAALLNFEQGEANVEDIDRRAAEDRFNLNREKRFQKSLLGQFNRQFSMV